MAKKSNCIYYDYYWYHRESSRSMMKRFMPSHGVVSVLSLRLSGFLTVLLLVFCSNTLVLAQTTEETYSSEKDKSTTSAIVSYNTMEQATVDEMSPAQLLAIDLNMVSQLIVTNKAELAGLVVEAADMNNINSEVGRNADDANADDACTNIRLAAENFLT